MFNLDVVGIRNTLREGHSQSLERRRKIALFSSIGLIDFAIISLYQIGLIRHLPGIPGKVFDSDKVNASKKAYQMGLPDGTTGAALYAVTLMLASAGGVRKTGRRPLFTYLLGGAVFAGVGGALQYLYDMAKNQKKACPYCITGALMHFSMVPLVIAELRETRQKTKAISSTAARRTA